MNMLKSSDSETNQQQQHPISDPLSRTTRVSQYQKGKNNLNLLEQETICGFLWLLEVSKIAFETRLIWPSVAIRKQCIKRLACSSISASAELFLFKTDNSLIMFIMLLALRHVISWWSCCVTEPQPLSMCSTAASFIHSSCSTGQVSPGWTTGLSWMLCWFM